MVADERTALQKAQSHAESAYYVVWAALIFLGITAALEVIVPVLRAFQADGAGLAKGVRAALVALVSTSPTVLFATALWHMNAVLDSYRQGEFFTPRSTRALLEAGLWADSALVMKIVCAPTLVGWISQTRRFSFDLDPADLGMLALATGLTLMGFVLEAATAIKTESDQIV